MYRPEITVTIAKAEQQPASAFSLMSMALMGAQGAELYDITIACPHGEISQHVLIRACKPSVCVGHGPGHGQTDQLLEQAVEEARRAFPQTATCACGYPYWAQHGPLYEIPTHLGPTQLIGPGPADCFSAN